MDSESPPYALTRDEYELVDALAEAIVPSGTNPSMEPGAKEVGVKNFFDSTVLEMSEYQRSRTKEALALIDARSRELFAGRKFSGLTVRERGSVLKTLLSDGASRQLFVEVRAICVSGFYSDYRDPDYKGIGAWAWLGYEGKRISGIKKDWSFLEVYRKTGGAGAGK